MGDAFHVVCRGTLTPALLLLAAEVRPAHPQRSPVAWDAPYTYWRKPRRISEHFINEGKRNNLSFLQINEPQIALLGLRKKFKQEQIWRSIVCSAG